MTAPVVVFAVGNPSRGDDALGPMLCVRLQAWLDSSGLADQVELIEDFQLNIEHSLDLIGRRLALFVDAGAETRGPFAFAQLKPASAPTHSTHALLPETVLHVYSLTEGQEPPPAFVLCIRGETFELGAAPGQNALANLAAAHAFVQKLLSQPTAEAWLSAVGDLDDQLAGTQHIGEIQVGKDVA